MHADGETFTMAPLLMTRRSLSTQHQALPVHVRARVGSQGDLGLEVAGQEVISDSDNDNDNDSDSENDDDNDNDIIIISNNNIGGVAAPVSDSASAVEPRKTTLHKRSRIFAKPGWLRKNWNSARKEVRRSDYKARKTIVKKGAETT